MSEHQESYPIVTMCRVLGVSPSGYYAWRQRPPSARAEEDAQLRSRIERIHSWSRGTYGAPRIRAELADEGQRVSRKRVARLMKEVGVEGVSRRRRTLRPLKSAGNGPKDGVSRGCCQHDHEGNYGQDDRESSFHLGSPCKAGGTRTSEVNQIRNRWPARMVRVGKRFKKRCRI